MSRIMSLKNAIEKRDFLKKKIRHKMKKANFVDTIKTKETRVFEKRISKEEFAKEAESEYQQITDLISEYRKLDEAILLAQANTEIHTSRGTYCLAYALKLHNTMRSDRYGRECFEKQLLKHMKSRYASAVREVEDKKSQLRNVKKTVHQSDIEGTSELEKLVDMYVEAEHTEVFDPLNLVEIIRQLEEKYAAFVRELETLIQQASETTIVEIA